MRNKIYHNLGESEYKVRYSNIVFYFSSPVYARKYEDRVQKYVDEQTQKFQSRYHSKITLSMNREMTQYFAIALYRKIETRGVRFKKGM